MEFEPWRAIKAQAIADYIRKTTRVEEIEVWKVHMDEFASVMGSGVGIVMIDPQGLETHVAVKFEFQTSNNGAEYELIRGVEMADELGALGLSYSQISS